MHSSEYQKWKILNNMISEYCFTMQNWCDSCHVAYVLPRNLAIALTFMKTIFQRQIKGRRKKEKQTQKRRGKTKLEFRVSRITY